MQVFSHRRAAIAMALCMLVGTVGTATAAGASGHHRRHHTRSSGHHEVVKIGFVGSVTGPLASSEAISKPVYQAWQKWTNAHGGVDGVKVEVVYKDDHSDPGTSLTAVHQLVEQDHVAAIVDAAAADTGWAKYVQQAKVPVIGQNISNLTFVTNPDFFPEGQTNDSLPVSVALAAKKVGAKKFGLFYCAESPDCQELVDPEKQVAAKEGVPLAFTTQISASAPSYAAPCLSAKEAGAGALFIADAVSVALSAAQSCVQQGYTPRLIADDGAVSKSFRTAPGWDDGMISMQPDMPFFVKSTPATKTMYKALRKYEPSVLSNPLFNEEVTETWTSGLLLTAAGRAGHLGRGGHVTSAQLYKGLYSLHGETLGGMSPPLTFAKNEPHPVDCWFWMGTKHKKFTTQFGLKPTCAPKS